LVSASAAASLALVSTFDKDNESWRAYDYNGGIAGGGNVWFPLHWESRRGVGNSGYAWADDFMWRINRSSVQRATRKQLPPCIAACS